MVPSPVSPSEPSFTPTVKDVKEIEYFAPLEPGTYSIDPDLDPSTPLRVEYDIPAKGWSRWIGAWKVSDDGHVGVSITTVTNLVATGAETIRGPIRRSDRAWTTSPRLSRT